MKRYIKTILIGLLILPLFTKAQTLPQQKSGIATITVDLEDALPTDTLMLMYFKDNLFNEARQNGDYVELNPVITNTGLRRFKIPITNNTGYFFIAKKISAIDSKNSGNARFMDVSNTLKADADDDVLLKISHKDNKGRTRFTQFSYQASGVGSEKFKIRLKADSVFNYLKSLDRPVFPQVNNFIDSNKNGITPFQSELLRADLIFSKSYPIFQFIKDRIARLSGSDAERFKNNYYSSFGELDLHNFSPEILIRSKSAVSYFLAQAEATILIDGKGSDPNALYTYLCENYNGIVLDKLLVYYFVKTSIPSSLRIKQLEDATKRVKTPNCLASLNKLTTSFQFVALGKEYNLTDITGKSVSLSDFKGKMVLVDFWFTGCAFCSKFVKEQLIKVEEVFKGNPNVVFISLSIDRDKTTWLNSVQEQKYSLSSSVNLYTSGFGSNHPLIKRLNVQGYPSLLMLDKTGALVGFGVADKNTPSLYLADQIITKIKSHL